MPGIAGSVLLLFVEAIADLANPLVLGGDYTVLASRAYLAVTGEYNVTGGAAYSLVLLLPALSVFLVQRYWVEQEERRHGHGQAVRHGRAHHHAGRCASRPRDLGVRAAS